MDKEIYNSIFQEEIHDLITLKRALGFSYRSEAGSLRRIDTFLCENNLSEKRISKELCDLWCRKRTYETVTNQASRVSIMRVFCRYLNDIGIPAYTPPKGITRKRSRYDAHIYTDKELQSFFEAVDKSQSVPDSCPYRADVMPVFFRILYTSGMRVSELRLARIRDINFGEGYITVHEAKNHKERYVPIHPLLMDKCKELKEKIHAHSSDSLIDTANAYVNERAVGRAIKDSGIDRKNIFLSTKIWASEYENENTVEETLERLGVDYVDLLYIHQPAGNWLAGYRMLEKAYREGKAKSIGISNFEGKYMEELETKWKIVPQFIQVEAHPYFTQKELRVTLDKYGIKLMSWYPLGHGDTALMNELVFAGLGKKYGKTPAQVILRWHTQMGFVVIPGSKNAEHIKDNMDIFDFALTDEEMEQIAKLDKNERYYHRTDEQLVQFANWKPEFEK